MEGFQVVTSTETSYEELPEAECRRLLAGHDIGRLGVVVAGAPVIFPVNYVFHEDAVVFRTDAGTKLSGSALGRVAFEIDGVDEERRCGWSVLVQGVSAEIGDALDHRSERLRQLDVQPWAPGEKAHWVALHAESISGRRVQRS